MKVDIWMPLVIGDYLADTMHLTTEQHGAYLLLLMHYWRKGPLAADPAALAPIAKLSGDAWSNAWALLEPFFPLAQDSFRHNKRADEELAGAAGKREKAKEKAEKAAAARWGNASSNAPSIAHALLEQCPSPSPSPS